MELCQGDPGKVGNALIHPARLGLDLIEQGLHACNGGGGIYCICCGQCGTEWWSTGYGCGCCVSKVICKAKLQTNLHDYHAPFVKPIKQISYLN